MIRKGTTHDLERIMKIVTETLSIMKEQHNDQWTDEYPQKQVFEQDVQNGALYVEEKNGQVIGSITIDQQEAAEYKPIAWQSKDSAYVFHRLLVDPKERRVGTASSLLAFAEQLALSHNVPYMKADTYSLNKGMQRFFERNGYELRGEMSFHGKNHPFYCYDKRLDEKR
ncbi:hypothetical protein AMD01_10760 [Priestia koreensis]|uniref:N-acetyltransferase domain-containing protein n=2 Tax=Priestia koreensis TaxID=284581 RepID=A0A0M0L5H1_9BACI|nr:hypothetical protein AMD01_10760 [Priestia koreensis]